MGKRGLFSLGMFSGACPLFLQELLYTGGRWAKKEQVCPAFSRPPKNRQTVGRPSPFLPPPNPHPLCYTHFGSRKNGGGRHSYRSDKSLQIFSFFLHSKKTATPFAFYYLHPPRRATFPGKPL